MRWTKLHAQLSVPIKGCSHALFSACGLPKWLAFQNAMWQADSVLKGKVALLQGENLTHCLQQQSAGLHDTSNTAKQFPKLHSSDHQVANSTSQLENHQHRHGISPAIKNFLPMQMIIHAQKLSKECLLAFVSAVWKKLPLKSLCMIQISI